MLGVAGTRGDSLRAKEMAANKTMPVYLLSVEMRFILISTPVAPTLLLLLLFLFLSSPNMPSHPIPVLTFSFDRRDCCFLSPSVVSIAKESNLIPFALATDRIIASSRTKRVSLYVEIVESLRLGCALTRKITPPYRWIGSPRHVWLIIIRSPYGNRRDPTWKREWTP